VTYEGTFNYSAINNLGAREAKGEYLLLLNNDTECISEELLEEMVSVCSQPHVGGVGARLYYGDDTIQHAGVILGLGGIAGHGFAGERRSATGYCRRIICRQELSAVTAACMMVKREAFDAVGGFDEELEVTFNDVDLCMRIRGAGYRIIYDPYAELYHYESKSRGAENTPEKVERFHREIRYFQERWRKELEKGDPFYSPCLTRKKTDFSLRDQRVEPRIWTEMKV
jgi:GT2 family glycosyltransferase